MHVNSFSWNIITLTEEPNVPCMEGTTTTWNLSCQSQLLTNPFFQGSKTFWSGIYKIIFIKYLNSVFNCSRVHCIYTSTIDFFFHKLYEQQSFFSSWNSIDTPTRVKSIKTSSRSNFRTLNDYTYTNYNLNDFVENCPSVVQDFYQQKRGNPR